MLTGYSVLPASGDGEPGLGPAVPGPAGRARATGMPPQVAQVPDKWSGLGRGLG